MSKQWADCSHFYINDEGRCKLCEDVAWTDCGLESA